MKILVFALLPSLLLAQTVKVTPGNPAVRVGGRITIQADRPVKFVLQGAGSISAGSGTSTIYAAPATATPQHVVDGCMVLPSDSVFNTRIDNLPVHKDSAVWVPSTLIDSPSIDFAWGINVVDHTIPMAPYDFIYTQGLNGALFPLLPLSNRKRETGSYTTDGNNDHHLMMVNHETCTFYEMYHDVSAAPPYSATSGWTYASTNYQQPIDGTTDAASLPLSALVLHLSEIKSGEIKHALRFPACTGCVSSQWVWPAMYSTGGQPGDAPMGTRFRLKSSYDISGFPPAAQVVLNGLKHYGMILADLGTTAQITASTDITEDTEVTQEVYTITNARIPASAFEVVDESSLILNPALNIVNPTNPYVRPANQAVLTITDLANPANQVTVPIAIQPVLVGMPDPHIIVQAGTETFQLPHWVNNASNQQLDWTMGSGAVGALDSQGNYKAPADVSGEITFTVTAASVQDPTASATVSVTVIPAGVIRIDSGSTSATVDEKGNTWLPDLAMETAANAEIDDSYPIGAWGNIPDLIQTQTYIYTWGDDIEYRMHVPNGKYTVSLLMALGSCSGTYVPQVYDNGLLLGPEGLEVQNQLVYPAFNLGAAVNYKCRVPVTVNMPAVVSDTTLRVEIRAEGGQNHHSAPGVNGVIVTPTPALPAIQINTQGQTNVQPGQSLALSVEGWSGPLVRPVWAVTGPGTITQSGLYTAPASGAGAYTQITVLNPLYHISASTTLWIPAL